METNDINMQDDKFKELLSGTKIKASDNLKYRIMHQIETEKALSPKKEMNPRSLITSMVTIFGIMYVLIIIVGIYAYSTLGKTAFESAAFFIPVILISSVCVVFWMISTYDDSRKTKRKGIFK